MREKLKNKLHDERGSFLVCLSVSLLVCCCSRLCQPACRAACAYVHAPPTHLVAWRIRREERQRCRHRRSRTSTFAPQAQEDRGHTSHGAQPGSPGTTASPMLPRYFQAPSPSLPLLTRLADGDCLAVAVCPVLGHSEALRKESRNLLVTCNVGRGDSTTRSSTACMGDVERKTTPIKLSEKRVSTMPAACLHRY